MKKLMNYNIKVLIILLICSFGYSHTEAQTGTDLLEIARKLGESGNQDSIKQLEEKVVNAIVTHGFKYRVSGLSRKGAKSISLKNENYEKMIHNGDSITIMGKRDHLTYIVQNSLGDLVLVHSRAINPQYPLTLLDKKEYRHLTTNPKLVKQVLLLTQYSEKYDIESKVEDVRDGNMDEIDENVIYIYKNGRWSNKKTTDGSIRDVLLLNQDGSWEEVVAKKNVSAKRCENITYSETAGDTRYASIRSANTKFTFNLYRFDETVVFELISKEGQVCLTPGAYVTIEFSDDSFLILQKSNDDNCEGTFTYYLGSIWDNVAELERLSNIYIRKIELSSDGSLRELRLDKMLSSELKNTFECLSN